jgi:hypothetical protein
MFGRNHIIYLSNQKIHKENGSSKLKKVKLIMCHIMAQYNSLDGRGTGWKLAGCRMT